MGILELTGSDWLALIAGGGSAGATILGGYLAWRASQKQPQEDDEPENQLVIKLHEDSDELIRKALIRADELISTLKELIDIVAKHRHAVGDQTAAIVRGNLFNAPTHRNSPDDGPDHPRRR